MYAQGQDGLDATYRQGWRNRNVVGYAISAFLIGFYIVLYFGDRWGVARYLDAPAQAIGLGNRWYLYGGLYCLTMTGGAAFYLRRHGASRYNRFRIGVNLFVQYVFGFSLPFVMEKLEHKAYYFSYFWPLKMEYFYPSEIFRYPTAMILYSFVASLVVVPLLTLRFGKRWYCSWVCGCGALANTFGDPWRHLSNKSSKAWRVERVTIHTVLVLAVVTTLIVGANWTWGKSHPAFSSFAFEVQGYYGLIVASVLAGPVGTGLYPVFGPRVWCRFACPMAAMLGLIQKLGRFRIRVKKDMCISCGNCSTYCEMGIDVRSYAQRNETFTRASCVGCGMCAHVCPRGVLKLEATSRRSLPIV